MMAAALNTSIRELLAQGGEVAASRGSFRGVAAILFSPSLEEAEILFRRDLSLEVCGALSEASGRDLLSWARRTPQGHVFRKKGLAGRVPGLEDILNREGLGGLALSPLVGEESILGYLVLGLPSESGRTGFVDPQDAEALEEISRELEFLREEAGRAALRSILNLRKEGSARGIQALLVLDNEDRILFSHGVSRFFPSWGRGEVVGQPVRALPGGRVLAGMDVPGSGHVDWRTRKMSSGERDTTLSLASTSFAPSGQGGSPWRAVFIRGMKDRDLVDDGILMELALRVSRFGAGREPGGLGGAGHEESQLLAEAALAAAEQARAEESIDLSGLFRGFLHRLEPELRDDRIQVLPFLGSELPTVQGGRRHLETALWAILRKSWASLLPRGGTLTLRTWEEEGSVWCTIADDGKGTEDWSVLGELSQEPLGLALSEEDLPQAGLEMAKELIRAGGGTFHVEVRPQLWTRYAVVFPAARVAGTETRKTGRAAIPPAVEVHRSQGGTLEVLVVDDNEMVRTVLRKFLERAGHEVTEADDGSVALDILREQGVFDHVMVDIDMPGTTGIEFFQQLDGVAPHMKERTVFMTGGFQEGEAEDFIQGTGRPHIQKPFDLKVVSDLLQA